MFKDKLCTSKYDSILGELEKEVLEDRGYTSYFSDHKARYRSDLQVIDNYYTGGEILEIGSLPCHLTYCLKELGYPVIGLDLDPERSASFIKNHGLEVLKCDIENERIPLDDGRFDLILFNEVFEHLRIDPIFALREISRVIKRGGTLILTTPNLYSLENVVSFFLGKGLAISAYKEFAKLHTVGHMGHIREYSRREIKEFLGNTGFQVIDVKYRVHNKSRKGIFVDFLYYLTPFCRPYLVVICRKKI
jgi:SAM-dependent methyltransferase